ncbi:MAG TPA: hypothetical protein VGG39_17315 [Polyangiaceae bacterium]|jgi:hypothetical protein
MPPRRQPFTPEADTQPGPRATARPPKKRKDGETVPPPPPPRSKRPKSAQTSGTRSRRPAPKGDGSGATVDEVIADMSKDPRRERD